MLPAVESLHALFDQQAGVVARRQLLAAGTGLDANDVRRKLRRGGLVALHPGVYANHNGELTWIQSAWAAVLLLWPAALCHQSAIRAANGPCRRGSEDERLHIAVDRKRSVDEPDGVRVHRVVDLDAKVQWNRSPPRVRIEHAVVDVAAEARGEFQCVAALADAVQSRLTTVDRIKAALDSRSRIARRGFISAVLSDIAHGACSVLERGYLERVERPHGLPGADRQVPASARGPIYRDVEYASYGLVVELDGRLFHDNARARDSDLDRDLLAAVEGRHSLRLGWGQVFDRPCVTAELVGNLLLKRGWEGPVLPCSDCALSIEPRSGVTA